LKVELYSDEHRKELYAIQDKLTKHLALYEAKPGGLVELAKEIASEDKLRDLSRWSDLLHIKDLIEALKAKLKETEVDDVEKNVD